MAVGEKWIEIGDLQYLGYTDINDVFNNVMYISNQLRAKGYDARIGMSPDTSKGYATPPDKILGQLNAVEGCLDTLQAAIDWDTDNYGQKFIWRYDTRQKYEQVRRWLDYLQEMYATIVRGVKTTYLYDKDVKQIFDKDGKPILVYEGVL